MAIFEDMEKINNQIEDLDKLGIYTNEQINTIKFAFLRIGDSARSLIDPTIPVEYMTMYINLKKIGIDIKYYIENKWHTLGFSSDKLYSIIFYASNGYDVSKITPNMSKEDIENTLRGQADTKLVSEMIENSNLSDEQKVVIRGLNPSVSKFLLKKAKENDISEFLTFPLGEFDLEQIKYLFAIYSIGEDISNILDPKLTVEEMKERELNSNTSAHFLEEIKESYGVKKG